MIANDQFVVVLITHFNKSLLIVVAVRRSIISFLGILYSHKILLSWLCMELRMLMLIPAFFHKPTPYSVSCLYSYLMCVAISSVLFLTGSVENGLLFLLYLSVHVKFGLCPFMGWLYGVAGNVNWAVVWIISIIHKVAFVILTFHFIGDNPDITYGFFAVITLLYLGTLLWCETPRWGVLWAHMMLSSSCIFLTIAVTSDLSDLCAAYFVYSLWGSLCVMLFHLYSIHKKEVFWKLGVDLYFVFVVVVVPITIGFIYKTIMVCTIYSAPGYFITAWVVYRISEQIYLIILICTSKGPKHRARRKRRQ